MPHSAREIRIIALGLIRDKERVFLSQGFDPVKERTFYRAMGGGVDFGETSQEALKREFIEEIQAEITNIEYLTCIENIFVYNGKPGHEIVQLYQCDFLDPQWRDRQEIIFYEKNRQKTALWVDIDRCRSGELYVVPEQFIDYLN
jgi:8-oxo-dGTP pyrophosphatase MutT (NUDIX family)